jgi:hypothetical protein
MLMTSRKLLRDKLQVRHDGFQIVPPLLPTSLCGGHRADLGEKREPRETVYDDGTEANEQ